MVLAGWAAELSIEMTRSKLYAEHDLKAAEAQYAALDKSFVETDHAEEGFVVADRAEETGQHYASVAVV